MVFTGSLQLAHGAGLCKNPNHRKQFKGRLGRSELRVLDLKLSSRVSFQQHKSLSFHVSDSVYRPPHTLPYRHNAFTCRSFLPPAGMPSELPRLKIAASALTRSFNVLQGSPHLPKLAIAAGITAFAAWGFLPLVRLIRNLILHKKDNGWKKSKTHYIMTSYIQPLLLWLGSLLICRALDPVFLPTETGQIVKERLLNFVRSLSTVLAFAYCLSGVIQQTQKFFIETNDSNDTRNMGFHFAGKAVYSAVWIAAFALFMELLGFSTQKWVTAGGLGTVLLTLAGREIFTNFLSSAMIHATRPFIVNEWIQTKIEGYEVSGTVEHVGWWSPTIVRGEDREAVHIPNHKFTVNVVRNLTQKTHWRIKTHLAISHSDVHKINIIVADMRKVLAKNPHVEQQRLHRRVFLENINPENQALMILISCFVKTSHYEEYLCVKETILLDLLRVVSHHRARLATPIRTVQKIYSDIDLENIPFADSVFTRGGVPNRPLLLIEPSYKVNGEDKTKIRTVKPNGEQPKTTARSPLTNENTETENKADEKIGKTKNTNGEQKLDKKVEVNIGATPASKPKNSETLTPENKDIKTGQRMENDSKDDTKMTKSDSKTDSKIMNPNSESDTEPVAILPKIPRSGNQKSPTNLSPSSSDTSAEKSLSKSKNGETLTSGNKDIKTGQKTENEVDDPQMAKSNSKMPNLDSGSDTMPPKIPRSGYQKIPTNSSPESGTEKPGGSSTAPIPIQNSKPAIPKPALEENIVLGVALEGSKRTLPIEEETAPPLEEVTERSGRLGQGSPSDKDNKKEGQHPSFPSSTSPDQ